MSTFRMQIDHIVTTRVEVEVAARTRAEAEAFAKRAVIPQSAFNPSIKSLKRRAKTTKINIVNDNPWTTP